MPVLSEAGPLRTNWFRNTEPVLHKKTAVAAGMALALSVAQANAGGVAEPIMEPEVIVEESSASSGGFLVPLLLIAVLVAVASSGGGDAPISER